MANGKVMFLLALVFAATVGFVSSAAPNVAKTVTTEDDIKDVTGQTFRTKLVVSGNCEVDKNTITKEDDTEDEVIDDFGDGKGVILVSNSSQDCYIRDIEAAEKSEASTCDAMGMVDKDDNKPYQEDIEYVKSDTSMTKDEIKALPATIQAACQGKTVYKLLPCHEENDIDDDGENDDDKNDDAVSRGKRAVIRRVCMRLIWVRRRCVIRRICYSFFCRTYTKCYPYRYVRYYFC